MNGLRKGPERIPAVRTIEADIESAGQRLDNFLARTLKGVPKSHLYRMVRTGEVRVNSRRVDVTYRIAAGDRIRIPPVRTAVPPARNARVAARLSGTVLLEDDEFLAIDKPAGMAVHGGSGVSRGVIEQLRLERPQARLLELVHRLDRETSGVLLVAKKRSALTHLHAQLRDGRVEKTYLALVKGEWRRPQQTVTLPLARYVSAGGERRVSVDHHAGQHAETTFALEQGHAGFSLLRARLHTGRTHQIRVHLAHLGFPIAGDDKYGDFALNKALAGEGLKRMFLHAAELVFTHPTTGLRVRVNAPLPPDLMGFLARIERAAAPRSLAR